MSRGLSLVTGGQGFIGRRLTERLLQRGDAVRSIDIVGGEIAGAECSVCDITDPDAVRSAVEDVEVVFHVASMVHTRQSGKKLVWAVNHGGTQNVINACKAVGVRRLVYVSSASVVYEGRDIENGDESLPYARTSQAPYADSKIAAEKEALKAHNTDDANGLRTCAIRPHVVFGPGDGRFMPALLARARAGRLKYGVGRGQKLSDFTYITNLVDALVAADEKLATNERVGGQAYFVTNGEPIGFWSFVDRVLVALGEAPTRGRVPYPIAYTLAAIAESFNAMMRKSGPENGLTRFAVRYMCTHHYFSIEKARRDLGYEPKVSIDEGIALTIAHTSE